MPQHSIYLNPKGHADTAVRASFELVLQGYTPGAPLTVELFLMSPPFGPFFAGVLPPSSRATLGITTGGERLIGAIAGTVAVVSGNSLCLSPSSAPPAPPTTASGPRKIGVIVGQNSGSGSMFTFDAPFEESVMLVARVQGAAFESSVPQLLTRSFHAMPTVPQALARGTYPHHAGNTLKFYNDGSEDRTGSAGAFADIREAIRQAREFIFIADWSFHPGITLERVAIGTPLGDLLHAKVRDNPTMLVAIHTWDHINIAMSDPPNDDGDDALDASAVRMGMGSRRHPRILWRASSRTGVGFSHHQKFLVCDSPDLDVRLQRGGMFMRAFLGGLDLTQGRFDTPDHEIEEAAGGRTWRAPVGWQNPPPDDWYNAEFSGNGTLPRQPWHDIYCRMDGPSAWDVVREFVGRWNKDPALGITQGDNSSTHIQTVNQKFQTFFRPVDFVQQWEPHPGPWSAQICRSLERVHWGANSGVIQTPARRRDGGEFHWPLSGSFERSIQNSYLNAISMAQRFIYIETQYFIGSGSIWNPTRRSVANQIQAQIISRIRALPASRRFHVYLIIPMFPEGDPSSSGNLAQRQFQWNSILAMYRDIQAMGRNPHDYLTVGFPAKWHQVASLHNSGDRTARVRANRRYQIYVHSKHIIIDDRFVIIGSANLNERSLAGDRDSEIVTALWPSPRLGETNPETECRTQVRALRRRLFAEHFGGDGPDFDHPESAACADFVKSVGSDNWWLFSQGLESGTRISRAVTAQGHFCMWPLEIQRDNSWAFSDDVPLGRNPQHVAFGLQDSISGDPGTPLNTQRDWFWAAPGSHAVDSTDIAE